MRENTYLKPEERKIVNVASLQCLRFDLLHLAVLSRNAA
jgi:hypothetical protein